MKKFLLILLLLIPIICNAYIISGTVLYLEPLSYTVILYNDSYILASNNFITNNWSISVTDMDAQTNRIIFKNNNDSVLASLRFSPGIDYDTNLGEIPLPVTIEYFSASIIYNEVELRWKTSFEENNDRFEIYRNNNYIGFVNGYNKPSEYIFIDKNLNSGNYKYYLKQIDYNGNFEIIPLIKDVVIDIPVKMFLDFYPNPFNNNSVIKFNISNITNVNIKLYDLTGRWVETLTDKYYNSGYYDIRYNSKLSSGIYFCKMETNERVLIKKIVIIK